MAMKRLGLIHTSATLVPVFAKLCDAKLAGVEVFNISDDSLIKEVIREGALTESVSQRVAGHVTAAQQAGADTILVTCSSIGAAVEAAATVADVPVLRVDQPMADQAVKQGEAIGVAATLPTTLQPTADLISRRAEHHGRQIALTTRLCEGAFEALMSGDNDLHDQMVARALLELAGTVDVIVLAQASMARVAEGLDTTECSTPILTSPAIAIDHLATLL